MGHVAELLEKAHKIFKDHGGAVGKFEDDTGHVCALGALHRIRNQFNINSRAQAALFLDDTAQTTYGHLIVTVNDEMGKDAVNHCYELAIKRAREEEDHD